MKRLTLLTLIALVAITLFLFTFQRKDYKHLINKRVSIVYENNKYSLLRNGKPFLIKGVSGHEHLKKLAAAGGNTIRTYDTTNLENILKDAEANNIAVIAGLYLPPSDYTKMFYDDSAWVKQTFQSINTIVNKYKNSPALLMWCVGNELYFPLRRDYKNFYSAINHIVDMIHAEDPNHPVTTTVINFDIKNILTIRYRTAIDIISFNIFYGQLKKFQSNLSTYKLLWKDPFIITEWGIDGPWVERSKTAWMAPLELTGNEKAEELVNTYKDYVPYNDTRLLGTMAFYWGYKQESTHTWFSFFDDNGAVNPMAGALQYIWTGTQPRHGWPEIEKIFLDSASMFDNPVYSSSAQATCRVIMKTTGNYTYKWNIYPEDWHKRGLYINNEKFMLPVAGLIQHQHNNSIAFTTPEKEGAYRLFVNVYDTCGNFSTCNIPFYVMPKNN